MYMLEKIKKRNRICLTIVGVLLVFVLLIGFSYAYYNANVKEHNKSQTVIESKELGLIYTGVTEVSAPNMIPGDSFTKTFTVENISDVAVDFNIYMENVTNEFNEDLVYTIKDENGVVVDENILPKTKEGKTYLKTTINIEASELRKYTMEIKYKYYEDKDQSDNLGASFSGTVGIDTERNVVEDGLYIVSVDPNGGVYEESTEVSKYTMSTGETVELTTPTRENHTFKGWTIANDVVENNKVTVGSSNVTVVAKWELNGDVVAKINTDYYTTIQSAFNAAKTDDVIELLKDTTEKSTNDKNVTLNLANHKVTGNITNNGTLRIIDGIIENTDGSALINNGTLILGTNDTEVSQDSVEIIGTNIGIEQNGIFNFYDGYVEAKVGIKGGYNDIPEKYYVFVDHNNEKDCQKVYLVDTPATAVVKTIGKIDAYYFNLQDAINTTVLTNETLYAIRDFEAAYTLTVESGKTSRIDIMGYNVTTGYTITNNGTLNITDSAEEKGLLQPSVTITNNGILNISDMSITQTTAANVIDNYKELNLSNSTITGLAGYAVSNKTGGTINMDESSYLKSNTYALHNESTDTNTIVSGGNIVGVSNTKILEIKNSNITNGSLDYAITNSGSNLNLNSCNLTSTNTGINNSGTFSVNDGTYTTSKRFTGNSGTININSGTITSQSDNCIYDNRGNGVNISGGELHCDKALYFYRGKINITGGEIYVTNDVAIENRGGTATISDGYIEGSYGIYNGSATDGWGTTVTNKCDITGGTIIGTTSYALYSYSGTTNITGGTFIAKTNGIYTNDSSSSTINIGSNDGNVSLTSPLIIGENYGAYINAGTINFYDGKLKGQINSYYGEITAIEDGYLIKTDNELVDEVNYEVSYLIEQENIAEVVETGVKFNSLQNAVDSIESNGTVRIISDAIVQSELNIVKEKNITLDLNGKTVEMTDQIINTGILTIKDSNEEQSGTLKNTTGVNFITTSNELNIESGNFIKTNTDNYLISVSSGTLNLTGGLIQSTGDAIYYTKGNINITNSKIVSDGISVETRGDSTPKNLKITDSVIESKSNCLYLWYSTNSIENSDLTCTSSVYLYHGNLSVTGGNINVTEADAISISYGTVNIYEGFIKSHTKMGIYNLISTTNIYGGTVEGTTYGIGNYYGNSTSNSSNVNIYGGNIKGTQYGIYTKATVKLGADDETVNITTPEVIGGEYGIYIDTNGKVIFNDGIIEGVTDAYYGNIAQYADGTVLTKGTKTIDEIEYKTAYLIEMDNFLKVGDVEYNSFTKAINAIETEGTITLIATTEGKTPITIPDEKNITFDLNGLSYVTTTSITNNGTLNIVDSSTDKLGVLSTSMAVDLITNNGVLNINGSKLYRNISSATGYLINNTGTLNVNEGTLSSNNVSINNNKAAIFVMNSGLVEKFSATSNYNSGVISNSGSFTLNGGTVINYSTKTNISNYAISNASSGVLNMNDGEVKTMDDRAMYNAGTANIYNGNISSENDHGIYNSERLNVYGGNIKGAQYGIYNYDTTVITGGIIEGTTYGIFNYNTNNIIIGSNDDSVVTDTPVLKGELYGVYNETGTINFYDGILKGQTNGYYGTINNIPTDYFITSSDEIIEEQTYITNYLEQQTDIVLNETTNTSYVNLQTAIDEANGNDTLKLLKNSKIYYTLTIAADDIITLDTNGYELYTTKTITNNGTLNIIDSTNTNGKISTTAALDLISNKGILEITNIDLSTTASNYYALNNSSEAKLNSVTITAVRAISITSAGKLKMESSIINATGYGVYNQGEIELINNEITGNTYAVYQSTTLDSTLTNNTLETGTTTSSYALYNTKTGTSTLTDGSLNGDLYQNTGTLIANDVEIKDFVNLASTSNVTINDSSISVINPTTSTSNILLNAGTLTATNLDISITKNNTNSNTVVALQNNGTTTLDNVNINFDDTTSKSTNYGIKNNGTATYNSGNITINGGKTSYGIYSTAAANTLTYLDGTVDIVGTTAYGIYVNNGTVTMGEYDGSGTEDAEVSTTNPLVRAIGTTTGIGAKKVNGYLKYYDGKIIGSTNAKPDTTTEVEYNYEAKFYNETDTGYEYCVLEYMK